MPDCSAMLREVRRPATFVPQTFVMQTFSALPIRVTAELLADSAFDVEGMIVERAGRAIAAHTMAAFLGG